jgi:hypothetical protein
MGVEIAVPHRGPCPLGPVLAALAAAGVSATVAMVDGVLRAPGARLPDEWRDVRLRTPVGMVTLKRHPTGIAVVVFGNAEPALQDAQRKVAECLRATP